MNINAMRRIARIWICLPILIEPACNGKDTIVVSGELKTWHPVTITIEGPFVGESEEPNPFTDYRLNATFEGPSGTYSVPGYFAADGNAAETGAGEGTKWRVLFSPNAEGLWRYRVSFRTGDAVSLDPDPEAGNPVAADGVTGSFNVLPTDKKGRDFRGKGWLRYVGTRYLQFAGTEEWFLKAGTDSPENFLAYEDFDGTWDQAEGGNRVNDEDPVAKGFLHAYSAHVVDWREGDPTWQTGKGKGIIGALNYLADKGMNSVYFLTMNVTGDGDDVWPWTKPDVHDRFDCSKLDQWERVFAHMTARGILMHVITQETENDQLLDGGDLGPERELYYRELVARFGHHPALVWNLGEENTNTTEQIKAFAEYLHAIDPYDHPVVIHTHPDRKRTVYPPLLGFEPLQGASLQNLPEESHEAVQEWIDRSVESGHPWLVFQDEQGPHQIGVKPDADDYWHDTVRDRFLWGSFLAGAAGVEWYMGYEYAHNDLNCEDWRSRDHMWDLTRIALEFMHEHVPFAEMKHADHLTPDAADYVLANPGTIYAIYLPRGGSLELDLQDHSLTYDVGWFNPRTGGALQTGTRTQITGPGLQSLGAPPSDPEEDWVVLAKRSPR
jgi:hypothetical protein